MMGGMVTGPCGGVDHIRFTIYHHWKVHRVAEIPGSWFNIKDAVPCLYVAIKDPIRLQDAFYRRLRIIFKIPLDYPMGLVVYRPPRALEDDIWTEDLVITPRQSKAK